MQFGSVKKCGFLLNIFLGKISGYTNLVLSGSECARGSLEANKREKEVHCTLGQKKKSRTMVLLFDEP